MSRDEIEAFWDWWGEAQARVENCIESGQWDDLPQEIAKRVHAIHPDLEWELGPGLNATHHLCLSPKGNPVLRVITERWLASAPPEGGVFEFHPSRQARRALHLKLGDTEISHDTLQVAFEVDMGRERVDVTLHHPSFATLDERTRGSLSFLMLDGWFGEDGVERWIGAVAFPEEAPEATDTFEALDEAVKGLSEAATGERFAVLQGEDDEGMPIFVSVNRAIKRVDHLLLDVHLAIEIEIKGANEHGLPEQGEGESLGEMEQALVDELGEGAVYVGRETHKGKRTVHLHVAESSGALSLVEAWSRRHADRAIEVRVEADPQWSVLGRWG